MFSKSSAAVALVAVWLLAAAIQGDEEKKTSPPAKSLETQKKVVERAVRSREGYFVVGTTETAPVGHRGYTRRYIIESGADKVVDTIAEFMAADHPRTSRKFEIHDVFPLTDEGKKKAEALKVQLEKQELRHEAQIIAAEKALTRPFRRR